jgi:hypothetical protein
MVGFQGVIHTVLGVCMRRSSPTYVGRSNKIIKPNTSNITLSYNILPRGLAIPVRLKLLRLDIFIYIILSVSRIYKVVTSPTSQEFWQREVSFWFLVYCLTAHKSFYPTKLFLALSCACTFSISREDHRDIYQVCNISDTFPLEVIKSIR